MNSSSQLEKAHLNNSYSSKFELGLIEKSNEILGENLEGKDVLELGCGLGLTTSYLLDKGCSVEVVEQSEYFVKCTKTRIGKRAIKVYDSSWEEFDFKQSTATDIVLFRGLDCVSNLDVIFKNLSSVNTKTAIHIIITNTNSYHRILGEKLALDKTNQLTNRANEVGRLQSLNYDLLTMYFRDYSFVIEKFEGVGFKMFANNEMDQYSQARIDAFLEMGEFAKEHAVELYFKIKCA